MFLGEYRHTFDDKGRVAVPSRFRDALGPRFVITKGLESCLFVYTLEGWSRLEEELRALPFTRSDVRAFLRFLFSGAVEAEPDRQGRVVVPPHLRQHAKLDREAVIIGVSNRVEMWAPQEWEQYLAKVAGSPESLAERLGDLGIFG